jgi:hypothetical protein
MRAGSAGARGQTSRRLCSHAKNLSKEPQLLRPLVANYNAEGGDDTKSRAYQRKLGKDAGGRGKHAAALSG